MLALMRETPSIELPIYAFAIEEAMLHPDDIMSVEARVALSIGVFIFSVGIVVALWRATARISYLRLVFTFIISSLVYIITGMETIWTLSIALTGLIFMCIVEEVFRRSEIK